MKSLFKLIALVVVIGLASCTDNTKLATTDGTVIDIQNINKGDSTTEDGDGVENPTMDED